MYIEYVRMHVIYRLNQAEYVIHICVVAPQEYVNIYSTRRVRTERSNLPRGLQRFRFENHFRAGVFSDLG